MVQAITRRAANVLTAIKVRTAGPGKYHDGGGLGLYLRVEPNGSRFWVQRIAVNGKRRELGLGSPPVVSLAEARDAALQNKKLVRQGIDPLAEKQKRQSMITFAQAVEQYLQAKLGEFSNEKHRKQWRSTLNKYAGPVLGAQAVQSIGVRDVLRVLEPIWAEKTETASRLRGRIEAVLSWATVAGYREGDNPARWKGNLSEMLARPSKVAQSGNHPAIALADVAAWWSDLSSREGMVARALQFLTLTTCRSGEVRGAVWDEIDLNAGIWTIPASRMKARREHRVPLTAEALTLLANHPRMDGSPYVFFAPRGGALSDVSVSAVMRRMQKAEEEAGRGGYLDPRNKRPAVPHGLRSTFRQWSAEQGYDRDMAELQLAHNVGTEVERAYQRSDMMGRRRTMLDAWSRFLRAEETSNVVALESVR